MQEVLKGYLRYWDSAPSLDNLDSGSWSYLRTARVQGSRFEFGRYDRRDGSIELVIERPDPPIGAESQEEWEEKRAHYLKHCGHDGKLLLEALANGYLSDEDQEWMSFTHAMDEMDELIAKNYAELRGDIEDTSLDFFPKRTEENYFLDSEEYNHGRERIRINQRLREKTQRRKELNPKNLLRKGVKLDDELIRRVTKFKRAIYSSQPFSVQEFEDLGFMVPEGLDEEERDIYVIRTLDSFIKNLNLLKPKKISKGRIAEGYNGNLW